MKKLNTGSNLLSPFLLVCAVFLALTLVFPKNASAACNFYQYMTVNSKNVTWNSTCTIGGGTVEGVDGATSETDTVSNAILTLAAGSNITINAGGKLLVGSLVISNGTVAIQDTGLMKIRAGIYVVDADADGWADYSAFYDATASGRRRLSLMKDYTTSDCNDADGGTAAASTWYRDLDGDTYGNINVTTAACTQPGGYVSNSSDCYDSNANAKPGQTSCYTANRGDGSFDYDCSGAGSACNSCNTGSSSFPSLAWRQCSGGYCYTDPYDTYFTGYSCGGSTSTCGAGGVSCTGSKASACVYNPCSLSSYYATGTTGCTVSCR